MNQRLWNLTICLNSTKFKPKRLDPCHYIDCFKFVTFTICMPMPQLLCWIGFTLNHFSLCLTVLLVTLVFSFAGSDNRNDMGCRPLRLQTHQRLPSLPSLISSQVLNLKIQKPVTVTVTVPYRNRSCCLVCQFIHHLSLDFGF